MNRRYLSQRATAWWPGTGGPGYTEYPEIDIKAHRANAKWARRLAGLGLAAGLIATAQSGENLYMFAGFAWALFGQMASDGLRLQALEWEFELYKQENENDGNQQKGTQ